MIGTSDFETTVSPVNLTPFIGHEHDVSDHSGPAFDSRRISTKFRRVSNGMRVAGALEPSIPLVIGTSLRARNRLKFVSSNRAESPFPSSTTKVDVLRKRRQEIFNVLSSSVI